MDHRTPQRWEYSKSTLRRWYRRREVINDKRDTRGDQEAMTMKIGVYIFSTDYSIGIVELARALE